jgi:hypothetical protein
MNLLKKIFKKKNKYVDFVSDEHFLNCVKYVYDCYPQEQTKDIESLTENSLDLFKTIFDIATTESSLGTWIKTEEIRQSDKTISNKVGDFHQMLLGGVKGWENLGRGHPLGIDLKNNSNTIFMELKNKHNTVKGEDHKNVFDKLKRVLAQYPKSIVYYAYIIPKNPNSGEKTWVPSQRESNERIKEAWGFRVYEIVTGDKNSLAKTWKAIPLAINDIRKKNFNLSDKDNKKLFDLFKLTFGN